MATAGPQPPAPTAVRAAVGRLRALFLLYGPEHALQVAARRRRGLPVPRWARPTGRGAWTRARPRSARTRRSCDGRCSPPRPRPGRSWTGWRPARRWAACPRARCRHRRSARRTRCSPTRPTVARRPAPRCGGSSTTGCWSPSTTGSSTASGTVELPREVGLLLRRDSGPLGPLRTSPPPVAAAPREPKAVDSAGAGQTMEVVRHTEGLLEQLAAEPAPVLRSGGIGVRDLRRLARTAGLDEPTTALLLEVAYAAGLAGELEMSGSATGRYGADQQVLPTGGYEVWRAASLAQRWEQLARAWLTHDPAGRVGGPPGRPGPADHRALRRGRAGRRTGHPAGGARRARRPGTGDRAHPGGGAGPAGLAGAAAQPGPGRRPPGGAGRGGAARRDRPGGAHLVRSAVAGRADVDRRAGRRPAGRARGRRRAATRRVPRGRWTRCCPPRSTTSWCRPT